MHASVTQIFSSHVMGRVPLVRFSRPFTARVNPYMGHLSSYQSTRDFSVRMTSRIPTNLSHLPHPVRHLWGPQQPRARHPLQGFTDAQEEAIKANLLETAYKGRQPGDMMLRCNFSPHHISHRPSQLIANLIIGTILDVGGAHYYALCDDPNHPLLNNFTFLHQVM